MNILCDFHHSDLWWSHYLIFEKGLGHKLFRPRGMEWHENGYYFPDNQAVARQFLVHSMYEFEFAMRHFEKARPRLEQETDDTLYVGMDTINGCPYYPLFSTLTLDEFKDAKIDVIMATISSHQQTFAELRDKFKASAKLLREDGNVGGYDHWHPTYQNVLTSDLPTFQRISAKNKVLYHQRFDTDNLFAYTPPSILDVISSFHPGFRNTPEMVEFADAHLAKLERFRFFDYGFNGKNGWLNTKGKLTDAMRNSSFVWHVKPIGDGFGHCIHNAFAMGRPIITVGKHYEGTLAEKLFEDGKTSIVLDPNDVDKNVEKIERMSQDILSMSINAANKFKTVVRYGEEILEISRFMERLL